MKSQKNHIIKNSDISSELLFHYTQKLPTLKAILKSGYFLPCYSAQYGWAGIDFAIPVACFCDIPKNLVSKHVSYYGSYGLGMTKEWAKAQKISPVFYLDVNSKMYNTIENKLRNIKEAKDIEDIYYRLLYYVKKVCGADYCFRSNDDNPDIDRQRKFYNEREWRYVPKVDYKECLQLGNYREHKPHFDNERMKDYGAYFKPKDIDYILIKSESERKNIIEFVTDNFPKDGDLLISKIESVENIMNNG